MTLQQLRYFRTLAQVLHYTEAARQLFISQPTLSSSIADLEAELEVPLFVKKGKRVELTRFGEELLVYVREALTSIDYGVNRMRQMRRGTRVIELGYIYSMSFGLLPSIVQGFCGRRQHEDISFNFSQGLNSKVVEKLRTGELHLAFAALPLDEDLEHFPVFEQELYLAVPDTHTLAGRRRVSLDELRQERFVSLSCDSNLRAVIDRAFGALGFRPNIVLEVEECNSMASFIGSGFGVGIMPWIPTVDYYTLRLLSVTDCSLRRNIHLIWMRGRALPEEAVLFREYVLGHHMQRSMEPPEVRAVRAPLPI